MIFENRPVAPVIEKTVYESDGHYGGGNRNTRERANTALGFGIAGTVLGLAALWGRGNNGIGSLLGGGGASGLSGGSSPANININGGYGTPVSSCGHVCPTAFEAYEKSCDEAVALTSAIYNQRINSLNEATAAREVDVREKFGLYKSQVDADFGLYVNNRDNIDRVNNRLNAELFDLYKYTRDKDDETRKELCDLKAQVAISSAVRPYQDKLLQNEIATAFNNAINYIDRKTCKMITGTVVVPSTPTITGFGSYCCCNQTANAAAAGADAGAA